MGAVGIESLNIPVTSEALALDNAGTALKNNASSNPANHPASEFSGYGSRRWLDGFTGHSISYSFGERKPIKLVLLFSFSYYNIIKTTLENISSNLITPSTSVLCIPFIRYPSFCISII